MEYYDIRLTAAGAKVYGVPVGYSRKHKASASLWFLFWLAFVIGVTLLFAINREKVRASLALLKEKLGTEQPDKNPENPETSPETVQLPPITEPPAVRQPDETPAGQPETPQQSAPQPAESGRTAKSFVYMIRPERDGQLAAVRVERNLPVSDSPMLDALASAIRGPSVDEAKRNLYSLIPASVTILGATIRGSTAYINFNEAFLFNTWGIEGYAGQLRQIVWTATEFNNIKDVQILVEGKRVDYLGEGIWIGSPLNRESL